jgi:hypothetical protein
MCVALDYVTSMIHTHAHTDLANKFIATLKVAKRAVRKIKNKMRQGPKVKEKYFR